MVAGNASIAHSGLTSTITQSSDRLIIEWASFDTNSAESVRFNQPSSASSVLNRIISGQATIFDGSLFANGNVIIVNGAGIHFGPTSRVDVGSLIASTADISNGNFLNNRLIFDRPGLPDASITNAGTITVRDTGLAALVAPGVENSGLIQAHLGTVILGAGEAHTIDFNGDGLVSFAITKPTTAKPKRRDGSTMDALVSNTGKLQADGGSVILTARQASRVLDNSINMSGIVQANSVGVRNGKIVLFGGNKGRVNVSGKIRARGKRRGERGGRVHITGQKVAIPIAKIDVTGQAGGGEVLIGGAFQGGQLAGDSDIGYLQGGDLVSILTGADAGAAGNGYIPTSESVSFGADAAIDVSAIEDGDGGQAILWSDEATSFSGSILATGGANGGNGGFVEISGAKLAFSGTVDTTAAKGETGLLLLDPLGFRVFHSSADVLLLSSDPVLAITDTALNTSLALSNVLLATSPSQATYADEGGGGLFGERTMVRPNDDTITIEDGVVIDTGTEHTLYLSTSTLNLSSTLAGNISGGVGSPFTPAGITLKDPATVNVLIGANTRGSVDQAVGLVADAGTIGLGAGSHPAFTVTRPNLTFTGAGATTIVNAASPAITVAANGTTIQNMTLQGTGMIGDVGILLDGTAAPDLTGVTITNVNFKNLDDGIRSQGDIGDGVAANVDVAISGTNAANPAIFEDFLDAAIDVGDTDGDAVYSVTDVIVRDGDASGAATGDDGFRFGAVAGATVTRVDISGATGDGIQFGALAGSSITVSDSSIVGALDTTGSANGLNFAGAFGAANTISVSGNTRIESLGGLHGILFDQAPGDAATSIDIADNLLIQSAENQAIVFARGLSNATVTIRGNGTDATNGIRAGNDAIAINNAIATNAIVTIGGATAADGNYITSASTEAIDVEGIAGGNFTVANNPLISGAGANTIEFEGAISNGATVQVVANADISGATRGIRFGSGIADSTVTVAGNGITGSAGSTNGDAISFASDSQITDSTVTIGNSMVTVDGTPLTVGGNTLAGGGTGIRVQSIVDGTSSFAINGNTIGAAASRMGVDGIRFAAGITGVATVTIGGLNSVFAAGQAIQIDDLQSPSTLSITGGAYDGAGGALLVDNTGVAGTDGRLNVGAAAYVAGAGSTVFEVLTDAGNAGVDIDFTGAASFDGGANGIRLSGPGIDVLNDTFGAIGFGATTAQTGNIIELANGAEFLPGSPTLLDATGASFGGTLGSALTVAQLFALETQLVHFPDDATLGLINTNDLFVVQGESIQTAVNAAGLLAGAQTVTVTSGTFGGSVEVWVDNLTLDGQGATTIIDTDAVDPFANNGDADNGFQIAALSMIAGGPADVTGATIEGFAFDTLTTTGTNIGIELGETGVSDAVNATVQDNTFTDLNIGIQSNQSSGTTRISGNMMTAIATRGITFEDTLNTGDAITVSGNTVTSVDDALRFAAAIADASVIVSGNTLASTAADGARFAASVAMGSTVTISGNDIEGADDGVDFSGAIATGSTINIRTNDRIEGLNTVAGDDGLGDGIAFGAAISGAMTSININDNTLIRGLDRGINFRSASTGGPATITDASVTISGNADITGVDLDGILFNANISNANIAIGGANAAAGNSITGGQDGLDIQRITGGTFTIANNALIMGTTGDGVEFENAVSGGATIEVSGNTAINGAVAGVTFVSAVTDSNALVSGNTLVAGGQNGIQTAGLSNTTFSVLQNEAIRGTADAGLLFGGPVNNGSTVEVAGNGEVRGGNDGVSFASGIRDSSVTIAGNTQITGDVFDGVNFFGDTRDSNVTIGAATVTVNTVATPFAGNTITGGRDGIFHASGTVIAGASIVTYSNNDVTGSFDGIHFNGITESAAVTVSDNTNIAGLSGEGIYIAEEVENNATVTISGNTISGGDDGVEFDEEIRDDAVIRITGNTITGNGDGIEFEEEFENNATATISGNTIIAATQEGVEINGLFDNSSMTISGNTITGGSNGIVHEEEITGTATTTISGNTISGGNGIAFNDVVDTTNATGVMINDNGAITGTAGDGVLFASTITDTPVVIAGNVITGNNGVSFRGTITGLNRDGLQIIDNGGITGTSGDGVNFGASVIDSPVTIARNTVTGSDDGVDLAGMFAGTSSADITGNSIAGTGSEGVDTGNIGDGVAVTIGNNTISGTTGVRLGAVTTTTTNGVLIVNNTRIAGTTGHGIHLDGPVTNTPVTIYGNTGIVGAHTGIMASAAITDATINLDGNASVTGGVTGVHFESLSGATVDTANTTITGGATGFHVFGSAAAGATSRLNFTNSTIMGTLGAGIRVTTTTGGSGIDTHLGGGLTLTGFPSLALSGPNQSLVGDTLADTRFNRVNGGNYIELSHGALFDPGRPTIINPNAAFFDGVQVPAFSYPALVQSIENYLNDFDDDDTLGQIFFRPLLPSDVVDVARLLNQFAAAGEAGIRVSNPQTPGDWILRPDFAFDILFGDLLAETYPLGGCEPVFDADGGLPGFACLVPAHGADISLFVENYLANLDPSGQ